MRSSRVESEHSFQSAGHARGVFDLEGERQPAVELQAVDVLADGYRFGIIRNGSFRFKCLHHKRKIHDAPPIVDDAVVFHGKPRPQLQRLPDFSQSDLDLRMASSDFRRQIPPGKSRCHVIHRFQCRSFADDAVFSEFACHDHSQGMRVFRVEQNVLVASPDCHCAAKTFRPLRQRFCTHMRGRSISPPHVMKRCWIPFPFLAKLNVSKLMTHVVP